MTRGRRAALVAGGALLLAQLVQPAPPGQQLPGDGLMESHVATPPAVADLLRASCYDCHSDSTRWPLYARVAPVSWLVTRDVRMGRSNLDFSHWSTDPVREPTQSQRLRGICRDIEEGIMPPRAYTLMHAEARLSPDDRRVICEWTEVAGAQLTR